MRFKATLARLTSKFIGILMQLMKPFQLASWLQNSHLQTLGSVVVPRFMRFFPSKDRLFELPDGSRLVAECSWQKAASSSPTVIIVPGLNGSTISSYVRGTAAKAYARGFNVIRLNLRNGGNSEKYSQTLLHAGQSADVQAVVKELLTADQLPWVGIISFSFGGNVCLKAVAEWGTAVPKGFGGVVGISPMIDLTSAVNKVDHHAPGIYRWQLLRGLKSSYRTRNRLFPGKMDPRAMVGVETLRAYDEQTAKYNGFVDADDYYQKTSAITVLSRITVPVLLIQADDDAVIPAEAAQRVNNPAIDVIITRGGGHGGFITQNRNGDPDLHWAENRAIEFLQQLAAPTL